ncbi:glycoside hydrolase family 130 protein [Flavihumibacter petaseus]|uniref:Glycosidase n=1 Tax=Flavihumibacter petaseus NBRC 106054 TaxID=1220578 RepID=A0A0E9N5B5_9BACT|nr:glycoside hydrolase family 130 protein [Flavihumibacter petaseus]GAO45157.1 hypothetical protein FPE01S_04_04000 [Flavihumibacter petaseus NBRC 106054]
MMNESFFCKFVSISLVSVLPLLVIGQPRAKSLPAWAFGGFQRAETNPVISPKAASVFADPMTGRSIAWESNDTFNPGAVLKDNKVVVLYRAEDKSGEGIGFRTSRLGYAESTDGINFTRKPIPVLYPGNDGQKKFEWPGGCEDPRVAVTEDGTYVVFYTQWNRDVPRLGVATSTDLINWKKHGTIFAKAYGGKFVDKPHKSASIVTRLKNDRLVIAKVRNKYWMYWGELGVFAATSENLVDWEPVVDAKGALLPLIEPRKGYFDSHLTECGPPAVLTDKGILLLYNGKNLSAAGRDTLLPKGTYSGGQVLFDSNEPTKAIARLDQPFFRPMASFEKTGQYADGTVFMEGLVYFRKKWFLYYGCADSRVAVAIYDPEEPLAPDPLPLR